MEAVGAQFNALSPSFASKYICQEKIALLSCQIKDNVLKADITIYDILW